MQVLWNSKLKFVSVSQLLGLALCSLLWVCLWTFHSSSSYCLTWGGKKKGLKKSPPTDFKPTKGVLLVFLDAPGWGGLGFPFLPSYSFARMGARLGPQSSQLPSLQPRYSVRCLASTACLRQAGAFKPPVVLSLRCTNEGQLTHHFLTLCCPRH